MKTLLAAAVVLIGGGLAMADEVPKLKLPSNPKLRDKAVEDFIEKWNGKEITTTVILKTALAKRKEAGKEDAYVGRIFPSTVLFIGTVKDLDKLNDAIFENKDKRKDTKATIKGTLKVTAKPFKISLEGCKAVKWEEMNR